MAPLTSSSFQNCYPVHTSRCLSPHNLASRKQNVIIIWFKADKGSFRSPIQGAKTGISYVMIHHIKMFYSPYMLPSYFQYRSNLAAAVQGACQFQYNHFQLFNLYYCLFNPFCVWHLHLTFVYWIFVALYTNISLLLCQVIKNG